MAQSSNNAMLSRIARHVVHDSGIAAGSCLLVGVSGGPDSLCLLHTLFAIHKNLGITLHVAHVDHMLRDDSGDDADFVRATAERLGLPVSIVQRDVHAAAQAKRLNLHDAARRERYAVFAQLADELGAAAAAVAHTADDQAETVLMHVLRGAGTDGLAGMALTTTLNTEPASPLRVLRPLLSTSRAEVTAYCAEHNLQPRHDATNDEMIYTRNRIRHELLPLLKTYNPQIVAVLNRTAQSSHDDSMFLQHALDQVWLRLAQSHAGGLNFDGATWQNLAPSLQRAALRRAYHQLGGSETLSWQHVEQAREQAASGVGKRMPFPDGIWLEIGYNGSLIIGTPIYEGPQLRAPATLDIPGQIALCDPWRLESGYHEMPRSQWSVSLDLAALALPLVVRGRRAGERMRPAAGSGSKRVQDMFVDAKVPRALRDNWPIIADQRQIVWIAGMRVAEGFEVTPTTTTAVWIRVSKTT